MDFREQASDDHTAPARAAEPLTAVILDDNVIDQQNIRRMIQKADLPIACTFATDLNAFAQALDRTEFDIAFLDYHLADGTGFKAFEHLKSHTVNAQTPAIMVSSEAPAELIVQAMRNGCSGYIPKAELSVASLGQSVNLALQDVANRQFSTSEAVDLRAATQSILDGFARASETSLRGSANKILRTTRFLRECEAKGYQTDNGNFATLERECGVILQFLDDLQEHCRSWGGNPKVH